MLLVETTPPPVRRTFDLKELTERDIQALRGAVGNCCARWPNESGSFTLFGTTLHDIRTMNEILNREP